MRLMILLTALLLASCATPWDIEMAQVEAEALIEAARWQAEAAEENAQAEAYRAQTVQFQAQIQQNNMVMLGVIVLGAAALTMVGMFAWIISTNRQVQAASKPQASRALAPVQRVEHIHRHILEHASQDPEETQLWVNPAHVRGEWKDGEG